MITVNSNIPQNNISVVKTHANLYVGQYPKITVTMDKSYTVVGYPFKHIKGMSSEGVINMGTGMQINDIIKDGFAIIDDIVKFIKVAQYTGGDPSLISSYNVTESVNA